MEKQENRWSD